MTPTDHAAAFDEAALICRSWAMVLAKWAKPQDDRHEDIMQLQNWANKFALHAAALRVERIDDEAGPLGDKPC